MDISAKNKIRLKYSISQKIENYISSVIARKEDRSWLLDTRAAGKLFYLSEIKEFFEGTEFFCFGTGGSVSNLSGISSIKNKNIITTTYGPYYFQKLYGLNVNFWPISYGPVVDYILQLEKEEGFNMDLSETLLLVPTVESNTKIDIMSPAFKRLRAAHPEANYVLYHRMEASVTPTNIPPFFLNKGIEPVLGYNDHTLHNLFVPILAYLGVNTAFFSGVDLISSTGHFWNRQLGYQSMQGKPLSFPEDRKIEEGGRLVNDCLSDLKIFRLEKVETRLKNYPYIDFSKAIYSSRDRPSINDIANRVSPTLFHKCL